LEELSSNAAHAVVQPTFVAMSAFKMPGFISIAFYVNLKQLISTKLSMQIDGYSRELLSPFISISVLI
jgi:hypothetical protein